MHIRTRVSALIAVSAIAAALLPAVPALAAPTTGTVQGTIVLPGGEDPTYAEVALIKKQKRYWNEVAWWSPSDESGGEFSFEGVKPGTYTLGFATYDAGVPNMLLGEAIEYADADTFEVKAGKTKSFDVEFVDGVSISGVAASDEGPVSGVSINAAPFDSEAAWGRNKWATTDGDGAYEVAVLPGDYLLQQSDDARVYVPTYNDAYTWQHAEPFAVGGGGATFDFDLEVGSHLSGSIAGPGGPLDSENVGIDRFADGEWSDFAWSTPVYDVDGHRMPGQWSTFALPAGTYRLVAYGWDDGGVDYGGEYYSGHALPQYADTFELGVGADATDVDEIDFDLVEQTDEYVGVQVSAPAKSLFGEPIEASATTTEDTPLPADVELAYQWYDENDEPIAGATESTFTPGEQYRGHSIWVEVTAGRIGYRTDWSSTSTDIVGPSIPKQSKPTVSGKTKVGKTLTAKPGTWTEGTTFSYSWYKDGVKIKGQTKATLKLAKSYGKHYISVRVIATLDGYDRAVAFADAVYVKP